MINLLNDIKDVLSDTDTKCITIGLSLNGYRAGNSIIDCYALLYLDENLISVENEACKMYGDNYVPEISDYCLHIYSTINFTKALHELPNGYRYYYSNEETNRTILLDKYFICNMKLFGEHIDFMPYDLEITDITKDENSGVDFIFHIDGNRNVIDDYIRIIR